MKIYFHGATVDVTRSAYHVVTKHASVLDCGMFQGGKQEAAKTGDTPNTIVRNLNPAKFSYAFTRRE